MLSDAMRGVSPVSSLNAPSSAHAEIAQNLISPRDVLQAESAAASPLFFSSQSPPHSPPLSSLTSMQPSTVLLPPLTQEEELCIGRCIADTLKSRRISFQQLFVKADTLQEVTSHFLFCPIDI